LLVAIGAALLGMRATTWRGPWVAAAGICAAGIATTYSRAALLSLGVFLVLVALAGGSRDRKRSLRLLALAVTLGFVFGVVAFGDGWHARASSTAGDSAHVDSDRRLRAEEAMRLVEKQPVVGVGPGRYTIAVASVEHADLLPAHNIVLQEAAEGGVLAGFLVLALLVAIAIRARRDGLEATAVFALPALFLVLDAYPYVFPTGLAVSAVWLGMVFTAREHVTVNDV
jgi:O-antigen ligase